MGASSSRTEKEARQISNTFIDMMMNAENSCDMSQVQSFIQNIVAESGDINISDQKVDMQGAQTISCLAQQDMASVVEGGFKEKLTSEVKNQIQGLSASLNVTSDKLSSEIVNNLTSKTNLNIIQRQAASASQNFIQNLKAGQNVNLSNQQVSMSLEQIINGQATQVASIISKVTMDGTQQGKTTTNSEGLFSMFSSSTIIQIAYVFAAVVVLVVVASIIKALFFGRSKADYEIQKLKLLQMQQYKPPQYPQVSFQQPQVVSRPEESQSQQQFVQTVNTQVIQQ